MGCPSDQQYAFADSLPTLCAQTLFLGLNLTDQAKPDAIYTASSATLATAAATGSPNGNGAKGLVAGANTLGLIAFLGVAVML